MTKLMRHSSMQNPILKRSPKSSSQYVGPFPLLLL